MEYLNKIELQGIVGNARTQKIGYIEMARFSVATDYCYENKAGEKITETTWHQVVVFQNDRNPDLSIITKGARVSVTGRLRNNKYTDRDGNERTSIEILANQVTIL